MKKRIKKVKELTSLQIAKNPGKVVLVVILLANLCFFVLSASVIYHLAPPTLKDSGFGEAIFYTITMVLDAGCISSIIADVGETSVTVIIVCLLVTILGMIIFTGAVIGYLTNYISTFIEKADQGERKLHLSNHTVILNWNSRASEIVNDLLYSDNAEVVVVLVSSGREMVEREINERIQDSVARERKERRLKRQNYYGVMRLKMWYEDRHINKLTVIVREGDTYSGKQLNDISLMDAKAVIILGKDVTHTNCRYGLQELKDNHENGNAEIIKTLVQVAEITGAQDSADNQRIIVEVEDDWTLSIVNKIIEHKESKGKSNIVPVAVNRVLGQILSQFCVMPELNLVYSTLFSNKGAAFYSVAQDMPKDENEYFREYLKNHKNAIPLTFMNTKEGEQCYYMASAHDEIDKKAYRAISSELNMVINRKFWLDKKNVIILGHNSKSHYIMEGFNSFCKEWDYEEGGTIMDIFVIDDAKSLKRHNYYKGYDQVSGYAEVDIYDRETIEAKINEYINSKNEEISILILSDDHASAEELDANALVYLVYVQDIIQEKIKKNPFFDRGSIDVIVEILNPKNSDVVRSYSVDNVVISNRYVSKMMTQVAEKEALFAFYNDILTYDEDRSKDYESKELYAKVVGSFFERIPRMSSAANLIRTVYDNSPEKNKQIVLGYKLDHNYINAGKELLEGKNILFNNPFYYDLIPYLTYAMNRVLLTHKKILVVCGRHGIDESIKLWCNTGLEAVNYTPYMWNVGIIDAESDNLDVGILTRSMVHDLELHEANAGFFEKVGLIVLIEPSKLLTTAQIGLNSLVRYCSANDKRPQFVSIDKNSDGLIDALSHLLMTSITEVSATNHHMGRSSYMCWEGDNEHLQHRLLPNLSRYLGFGTELSITALKNQIEQAYWYGGEAFPVQDENWIVGQYYYDLLDYAALPQSQETLNAKIHMIPELWSARKQERLYITVEDEFHNLFEVKRNFATRAEKEGFINIISSDYLLKDYMAENDGIFNSDSKAIPCLVADYAHSARNVVLRVCLRMSVGSVWESDLVRELLLIDVSTQNPVDSLWKEICRINNSADSSNLEELIISDGKTTRVFHKDIIRQKRRYNRHTENAENCYYINDVQFIRLCVDVLKNAEYIAENEQENNLYLGSEIRGQIYQKHLPGQFFTLSGKNYEMLRVTSDGKLLLRRAADHIVSRPQYRQIRQYL